MPPPIKESAASLDLSPRFFTSGAVAASPAGATETIICTLTVNEDIATLEGVHLTGYCAFTAGADGASAVVRIRQTDASGTIIKASGAVGVTAAALYDRAIHGFDTTKITVGQVYVLTLTVASATAASTVSAAQLSAIVV